MVLAFTYIFLGVMGYLCPILGCINILKSKLQGLPLVVQWLRLLTSNAGCMNSIPGWETPHATQHGPKKKKKKKRVKATPTWPHKTEDQWPFLWDS